MLTDQNKAEGRMCDKNNQFFDAHRMNDILLHFDVEDESWVLYSTPRSKQKNMARLKPSEACPRTVKPYVTTKKLLLFQPLPGLAKFASQQSHTEEQ